MLVICIFDGEAASTFVWCPMDLPRLYCLECLYFAHTRKQLTVANNDRVERSTDTI